MTENTRVSNSYVSSNPDFDVKTTEKSGAKVQHFILDVGVGGASSPVTTANPMPVTAPIADPVDVTITGTATITGTVSTKTALTPAAPTVGSVGVASGVLVAANASRKGLILQNLSINTVSLGLANTAVLSSGITLPPYSVYQMDEYCFTVGAINAIASGAASSVSVQEFS
jgi:hypothetical protein